MAVVLQQKPLTYEEYLTEGETEGRYEIVEGIRYVMTTPSRRHQKVVGKLYRLLIAEMERLALGTVILAPSDILIQKAPLRTRQPDMFAISTIKLIESGDIDGTAPMRIAPDIAVEVLSPSDNRLVLASKLQDYLSIGVRECWMVSPQACTVELLRLNDGQYEAVEIYGLGRIVHSTVFGDLAVNVDDVFAE